MAINDDLWHCRLRSKPEDILAVLKEVVSSLTVAIEYPEDAWLLDGKIAREAASVAHALKELAKERKKSK